MKKDVVDMNRAVTVREVARAISVLEDQIVALKVDVRNLKLAIEVVRPSELEDVSYA